MSMTDATRSKYAPTDHRFMQRSLIVADAEHKTALTLDLIWTTTDHWEALPESLPSSGWHAIESPWGMTLGVKVQA